MEQILRTLNDNWGMPFIAPDYWNDDDISKWNEMTVKDGLNLEIVSMLDFVTEATKVINGEKPLEYINNLDYMNLPEKIESMEELVNQEKQHRNSAYELFQKEYQIETQTQQNTQEAVADVVSQENFSENVESVSEEKMTFTDKNVRSLLLDYCEPFVKTAYYKELFGEQKNEFTDEEIRKLSKSINLGDLLNTLDEKSLRDFAKDTGIPVSSDDERQRKLIVEGIKKLQKKETEQSMSGYNDEDHKDKIMDSGIESVQVNGGLSEAAIEYENRQNEIAQAQEEFEKEENSVSKEKQLLDKTNNSLEQSSLDKASELLKGIQFTPENYKKLLNVINDITEMSGNEQLKVPTEEQVQKTAQEKVQQPQNESQNMENEQKQNIDTFDPNAPVIYGKTILPAFTVMAEGKLHSIENAVVMKFDKVNQTYLIDNGNEKLELPSKTFETLLKDKQELEEKIKLAEGRTIVFQDKERGINGTIIPEFAMYTQYGLETFKDFVPVKHNPADDSYVISNGDTTMTVTAERFKEITAPERFENKFDENSPAWKKLCEKEYKDFFEPRDNTAYNFRHNLSVYCRKEANSPCDALHLAKDIISRMSKTEQKQTEKILKTMAHENESTNEVITRLYHEAIKEQPLNEDYIKKYQPDNVIARPMYDTISTNGSKIENDPALIRGSQDRNLTIGTTLKNINIETGSVFGKEKSSMHFDELKVISASKEGNSITVMDSNKSFIKLPRDTVLNMYKEQQLKEMKQEQRHYRTNSMNISYV